MEAIEHVNYDQLPNLALYLAFEADFNSKAVWRALEDASNANLHLFTTRQICQLEWASTQRKPKHTTARFNTLLMKHALEKIDTCD